MTVLSCVLLLLFVILLAWALRGMSRWHCDACHRGFAVFSTHGLLFACWACWRADRRRARIRRAN